MQQKREMSRWAVVAMLLAWATASWAADVTVDVSATGRKQIIDGFGSHQGGAESNQASWRNLYFDDLGCSMLRVDLTPPFISPYSDHNYVSPWYSEPVGSPLRMPDTKGPDNNNVRTYTGASDYTRTFGGFSAPIAVMGPDIDQNGLLFSFAGGTQNSYDGPIAQLAKTRAKEPADFKLTGSFWSPEPWVKISSGNTYGSSSAGYPTTGTPWPFIWGGNFAGGKIDVSDTPMAVFDDSALTSGTGPTSALTQFARSGAAYLRAYQNQYNVKFYAISIQNELNFEEFYNSATYPLASQYIAALKRFRQELDKYPDLATIKIMGPEDLLGSGWGMWQLGGNVDKNLKYLQSIGQDATALAAISQFCIHGYAANGTTSAGSNPVEWDQWANGWTSAPASGLPANVKGFTYYRHAGAPTVQLKSWMTETSGEDPAWLHSTGVEYDGGWSIALKIHQALTVGQQSAWEYWTFSQSYDPNNPVSSSTNDAYELTGRTPQANAPKYVAAKHFYRFIRPNAQACTANVTGSTTLLASAYIHDANKTLTAVFVNSAATDENVTFHVPAQPGGITAFGTYTSSNNSYWQATTNTVNLGVVTVNVPSFGVVTLFGLATGEPPNQPVNATPANGATDVPLAASLTASAFSDPDVGDTHGASQWQVREASSPTTYTVTVFDSGTTTALTNAVVPACVLDGSTLYDWHVRYQDNRGQWSPWSAETTFTTVAAPPINHAPNKPTNVAPAAAAANVTLPVTLTASAFSDRNVGDTHADSQWQVRTAASPANWSVVTFDSGTTTSLTSVVARPGILLYTTAYSWHVRYRDNGGLWSPWSVETTFTTGAVPGTDHAPVAPTNVSPTSGALHVALPGTLQASVFSDPDLGDHQIAARWQVRPTTGTWTTLTYDSNTMASTTNTCVVPAGRLAYNYSYTWRVRYRDSRNTWSVYSTPTPFTVMPAPIPPNAPTNISPAAGATHVALPVTLRASPYSDAQVWNVQTGSQWEVQPTTATAWTTLVYDSGPVAATNTCVIAPGRLMWDGAYTWRTRYRDSSNAWSPWSTGTPFLVMPRPPATWMVK